MKPRYRGVSHEIAAYASLLAGAWLAGRAWAPEAPPAAGPGTAIYSICLFFMLASSALYHRPTWAPERRALMRRVDHTAIYLLIAGTATPIGMIALEGRSRLAFLLTLWIGAALGMVKSLAWPKAPKPLSAFVYVLLSCASAPFLPEMGAVIGDEGIRLILAGGALYVIGALIYALRRPDPWPEAFGYHEIFHLLVILAAALHYAAILRMVS